MSLTNHEWWGLVHGMGFGAVFLLAFAGGLAGLYSLRPALVTHTGILERVSRLRIGVVAMAVAVWGTVLTGTWIVYPWYRVNSPTSPKSLLLANPDTADWHDFGMEWKEHLAWLSPFLATAVAFLVIYYGPRLVKNDAARRAAITVFVIAFAFAAVAGTLGSLITKSAPVH